MRFHQVTIQILDNGAVLMQVGCKSLGFASYVKALAELTRYYQNPAGVQREYEQKYGWPSSGPSAEIARTLVGYQNPPIMGGSRPENPTHDYPVPTPYPVPEMPGNPASEGAL